MTIKLLTAVIRRDIINLEFLCTKGSFTMSNIIITDDEPLNIRMAEFVLRKNGYNTISAHSGEECLCAVCGDTDLVLLDLLMPGLDGLQTYERLRSINAQLPVIFLTSAEDSNELQKIKSTGAPLVSKPFRPDTLLSVVRKALSAG